MIATFLVWLDGLRDSAFIGVARKIICEVRINRVIHRYSFVVSTFIIDGCLVINWRFGVPLVNNEQ